VPYRSEKQRRFMYARHPDIAARWDREGKNYVAGKEHGDKPPGKEKRGSLSEQMRRRRRKMHG
jgi:hypothetical protein